MTDRSFESFLDDYYAECDEHLTSATHTLLALEVAIGNAAAERSAIDELFRAFHSLKGISAMVGVRAVEQLAHHIESYLRVIRDRELAVSTDGIEALIEGTQRVEQVLAAHRFKRPAPPIDDVMARVSALVPSLAAPGEGTPAGSLAADPPPAAKGPRVPGERRWRCTFTPSRELLTKGVGVDSVRKRLAEVGTIVEAVPDVRADGTIAFQFILATDPGVNAAERLIELPVEVSPIDEPVPGASSDQQAPQGPVEAAPATAVSPSHVVRVDLTRLDDLMRSVGDLVISRARLGESLADVERHVPPVAWRSVQENAAAIDRQLRTLREGIMRVRLVPIGEIFRRMPLVVRDLARETGKKVLLDLRGQSTEIDKYLIERMMDPVLHLVRNAISHGIEPPAVRVAQGKRPEGSITLSASTVGEQVTIEIADDGKGVDADAVAAQARAAGLPVPPGTPDATDLLALLCSPGFSTKEDADRASGRGVGMAVVKTTVEQLSGTMSLQTEPGAGTRFTIQLPLTLAIADALIGRVGTEAFAIPQNAVREVLEVRTSDVRALEGNELVPYRNGALPIVRLARVFGIESGPRDRFHLFVVGEGTTAVGLAVDRIVGQREIVVRAIADPLVKVDGIAGATDLGDGRAVLILDPARLARLTRERASRVLGNAAQWGRLREVNHG